MSTISKTQLEAIIQKFITLVIILYTLIVIIAYLADVLNIFEFDKINDLLIQKFLINREGILVSIAAIFIGIYISVFTMLLTIKNSSLIVKLGEKIYRELIDFLVRAIIGATVYIIYVILYPLLVELNINGLTKFIIEALLGGLVIYMLLTAFRVLLAFILLFNDDIGNVFKNIDEETKESEEIKDVIFKLKHILDEKEKQQNKMKAEEMNNASKFKNPKNP